MKLFLKLLAALLTFATLALVLLTIYVVNFDPNKEKDRIIEAFREQTGRDLVLGGDIGLTLYPWLGLSLNDVTIGNRPGFTQQPFLHAEHMAVRVKTTSIVGQQFEIDTIVLHGLNIDLEVDAEGNNNWSYLVSREGAEESSAADNGSPMSFTGIKFGGVDVQDVALRLDDRANDVVYEVNDLRIQTDALVYGDPIDLSLSLQASSSKPDLNTDFSMTGTILYDLANNRYEIAPLRLAAQLRGPRVPNGSADIELATAIAVDLEADTLTIDSLKLTAPDATLEASINGRNVQSENADYQISLSMHGSDLAQLFRIADIEPLATQLAQLSDRAFTLQTSIAAAPGRGNVSVNEFQAGLLGSSVTGNITAENLQGENPLLRGSLSASGPDLPSVVEVIGQISGGRDSTLAQAGRELRQVAYKSFTVETEFDANLQTGDVSIPTLDIAMLGTTVTGTLTASELNTDDPVVRGRLRAEGEDLPLLMQIAGWLQNGVESPLFQAGEKLDSSGNKRFELNTEFDADLGRGNIQLPVLVASGLGLELNGNLTANDMSNSRGSVNGRMTLTGSNLREVLTAFDQAELAEVAQRLDLEIGISGNRTDLNISPMQLGITLAGSRTPNSPVQLAINAATKMNLDRESLTMDAFTIAGLGLDVRGNLQVNSLMSAPAYSGRLAVPAFNLRSLLRQLNQTAPDTADTTALQAVAITAAFAGAADKFALSEINLTLDDTSLQGEFEVLDFADPAISFALNLNEIDLDRYMAPEATGSSTAADNAPAPLPIEALRSMNLNGDLSIGQLQVAGMTLSKLSVTASLDNGNLNLSPINTSLYQGVLEGSLRLDASQAVPVATLGMNLQQVNLASLLTNLMGSAQISGHGQLQLALNSTGNSVAELKSGLSGNGSVDLQDGVLNGVDVAAVLSQLETILRSRRIAEINRGQQTAFDSFTGTLVINSGVIRSNDLLIRSPGFQVTGRGTLVDLNNDSIAYDLVTRVDRSTATRDTQQFDIGGYDLPIACSGTVSAPRCLPDTGEIVRAALVNEAQRRVGDLIERALGTDQTQTAPDQPAPDAATADQTPAQPTTVEDAANRLINRALDRLRDN